MKLLAIKNLITYWRMFGSTEVPIPKGAETLIKDTLQALEEYKEILEKQT